MDRPVWYCSCRHENPRNAKACLACGKAFHIYEFPLYERAFHKEPDYRIYKEACPRKPPRPRGSVFGKGR